MKRGAVERPLFFFEGEGVRVRGSGFRMGDTQAGEEGRCGGGGAKGGGGGVGNSHTDGHGQTRTASGGREGIVDAPAGRIGSEGNGTASALGERSYRAAGTAFRRRDAAGPV